jgi:hypothetical protein
MKKYKAKSLAGAQRRVRDLERQISERNTLLERWAHERLMLAKLAAETPQFFNPLTVMEAQQIRDAILEPLNGKVSA